MKYRLINKVTKEEHICEKVTIEGYDYYVDHAIGGTSGLNYNYGLQRLDNLPHYYGEYSAEHQFCKKVIATNNHSFNIFRVNIPKVVDEIWEKAWEIAKQTNIKDEQQLLYMATAWYDGYHSSQETHPFSKADVLDVIQSLKDYTHESHKVLGHDEREPEEFLQIWKEEQLKTLYYVG